MPSRDIEPFIARWSAASPSERANAQLFLVELCDLLGVPRPDPKPGSGYAFEFPVTEHHPDGSTSEGRIDLYKRAAFLLEAKQFQDQPPEPSDLHLALESAGAVSRKRKSAPVRGTGAGDDEHRNAELQPNCAKRLECAELAPAFNPPPASQQRQQAGRTPNASRGGSSALPSTASLQLSEKEKQIHEQGLVSVLRQLHDDLDAAVFAAYGWPATLTDAEILDRVVALNAQRAKEESSGLVRWLRPDYQNPKGSQSHQAAVVIPTLNPQPSTLNPPRKLPWPKTMAERVKAVNGALALVKQPMTAADVARGFARVKTEDVGEILGTLCTMRHARRGQAEGTFLP